VRLAFILAALALAACTPRDDAALHGCDLSAEREVRFTSEDAPDIVTARTIGPSCDRAFGLYTVASAEGHPIYSWTAPMTRVFGDLFVNSNKEEMQSFVERWSAPKIEHAADAPPWPVPDYVITTLDRATYEDIRARNLPLLCHLAGTGLETCVFWEPAAGSAGHFLDRDVHDISGDQHDPD